MSLCSLSVSPASLHQANAARLMWNCTGTALLVLTASDVDATNQSYYGEQKLYYMAADGSNECAVPLPKVGQGRHCEASKGRG